MVELLLYNSLAVNNYEYLEKSEVNNHTVKNRHLSHVVKHRRKVVFITRKLFYLPM